jgi:hypothetical protein
MDARVYSSRRSNNIIAMIIIKINYASTLPNVNITYDNSVIYAKVVYGNGGGGAATWGLINGTLSNQTDLQNALDAKVPYSGATANVNLGEYGISSGFLQFDTTPTNTPATQGALYWDDSRETVSMIMDGTIQHIGQDSFFYVKNSTGSTIAKGTGVRFAGTDGASGHILIDKFLANGTYPSTYFMGVTAESIGNGEFGQVMHFGELEGINTNAFSAGSLLYASTSVAGGFQTTIPSAPNNIVLVAATLNQKNNGAIVVRPTPGSNINTDEGVLISNPTNGQVLKYNSTSGLWENATDTVGTGTVTSVAVSGGTGISVSGSPITSSGTITVTNSAPDQVVSLTGAGTTTTSGTYPNFTITSNDQFVGTVTSVGLTSATSGVTIASSPITTSGNISLTIATASGSQNGLLTSTDWTTFNNKQNTITNPVTGTGTTNYVARWTSGSAIGVGVLYDNGTNVGIGTITPTLGKLQIKGGNNNTLFVDNDGSNYTSINIGFNGTQKGSIVRDNRVGFERLYVAAEEGYLSLLGNSFITFNTGASYTEKMRITSGGNLLIGSTTDSGEKLQVTGTMKVTGASTFNDNVTINQTGSNIQQIINSSVSTNPSITQYKIAGSAGWEHGMASVTNGYSYIFSYGTFGTGTAKFTLTSAGAATFASSVTLSSSASAFVVLDNTTATTGKQWRASSAANGRFFLTNVTDGLDAITLLTTGAATFSSSVQGLIFKSTNGTVETVLSYSSTPAGVVGTVTNHPLELYANNAPRVTITTGGNLGLNTTTPNIANRGVFANVLTVRGANSATSLGVLELGAQSANTTNGNGIGIIDFVSEYNTTNKSLATIGTHIDGTTANNVGGSLRFSTKADNGTISERMRLDASGNLGLGVTPSAWRSTDKALQINTYTSISSNNAGDTQLINNAFFNSIGAAIYLNSSRASRYEQYQGVHAWYNAPSGTAGNAITFTQAMTLTSAGRLLLGTATESTYLLDVNGDARISGNLYIRIGSGTSLVDLLSAGTGSKNYQITSQIIGVSNAGFAIRNVTDGRNEFTIDGSGAATFSSSVTAASYTINDAGNIAVGTTTGTKIGTATSQKLAFWNATPIVQPTTGIAEATFVENSGGTAVNVDSTFAGYTLQQIAQALKNMGILA